MQRETPEGVVLLCDFCRRDWDGLEPMVEGHHGAIICLQCVRRALVEIQPAPPAEGGGGAKFSCPLCLRTNIPLPRWHHPDHPDSIACRECILQAAGALSKSPHADWKWDGKIAL